MTSSRTNRARRVAVSGIAAAVLACTAALVSTGTAAAKPLDVTPAGGGVGVYACSVGAVPIVISNTWVRQGPSLSSPVLYTIPSGLAFRITGGPIDNEGIRWWHGHGNGQADGWTPEYNLSCA